VAGGVFTGLALRQDKRARDVLSAQTQGNIQLADAQAYDDARAGRDQWKGAATLSFGASLALGLTGLLLYGFDRPTVVPPATRFERTSPEPAPRPRDPASMEMSAAPFWTPGASGVHLRGRF
jgi:hypothetical protein